MDNINVMMHANEAEIQAGFAETLCLDFMEQYLDDLPSLRYDAEKRPEIIEAKLYAILTMIRAAKSELNALCAPKE